MNTPTFHTLTDAQFKWVLGISRLTCMELFSYLQTLFKTLAPDE